VSDHPGRLAGDLAEYLQSDAQRLSDARDALFRQARMQDRELTVDEQMRVDTLHRDIAAAQKAATRIQAGREELQTLDGLANAQRAFRGWVTRHQNAGRDERAAEAQAQIRALDNAANYIQAHIERMTDVSRQVQQTRAQIHQVLEEIKTAETPQSRTQLQSVYTRLSRQLGEAEQSSSDMLRAATEFPDVQALPQRRVLEINVGQLEEDRAALRRTIYGARTAYQPETLELLRGDLNMSRRELVEALKEAGINTSESTLWRMSKENNVPTAYQQEVFEKVWDLRRDRIVEELRTTAIERERELRAMEGRNLTQHDVQRIDAEIQRRIADGTIAKRFRESVDAHFAKSQQEAFRLAAEAQTFGPDVLQGEDFRAWREGLQLKSHHVAADLDIPLRTLNQVERGELKDPDLIAQISAYYDERTPVPFAGQQLADWREDLGLQRAYVARETGLTEQQIRAVERGEGRADHRRLLVDYYSIEGVRPNHQEALWGGGGVIGFVGEDGSSVLVEITPEIASMMGHSFRASEGKYADVYDKNGKRHRLPAEVLYEIGGPERPLEQIIYD
jgi:transcriptional regulator with XRE-family HTH domain